MSTAIECALSEFLQAHDQACAESGRHNERAQESRAVMCAAFTVFAQASANLKTAITDGPGDPLREAMASAVGLYQQAGIWASMLNDAQHTVPGVTFFGETVMLQNPAGQATARTFGRTSCQAIDRWNQWAPKFFELVGLPYVSAPKLMPTYHQSETVSP